jgi:N-acetylglutamate synthase-like GNAT family acetyltransferase
MRFVAVAPERQSQGIGKMMTIEFEAEANRRGLKRVYLHARETAVPFYIKLGYEVFDEDFIEVGIPHKHMQKFLKAKEEEEPRIEEEETKGSAVQTKDFNSWL